MYNFDDYPFELKYRLQQSWQDTKNNLIAGKEYRKNKYDINTRRINYEAASKVMVKNGAGKKL